jgi:hypothetical protein
VALFAVEGAIDDVTRVGQCSRELPIEIGIVLDNKKPQDLLRSAPADKRTLSRVDDYSRHFAIAGENCQHIDEPVLPVT